MKNSSKTCQDRGGPFMRTEVSPLAKSLELMRLQILVKFLRSLFQVMKCQMQIAVGFQSENDEVSRLQRLDNDVQILVAAADPCGCLS